MIDIDHVLCDGCGICVDTCPTDAIVLHAGKAYIEQELCQGCQACMSICPQGAILMAEQIRLIGNEAEKPHPVSVPESIMNSQPGVVSASFGTAIDSEVALSSSAKRNLPKKIVGRRQRNGLGQHGGHRQRKRRHKNNRRR